MQAVEKDTMEIAEDRCTKNALNSRAIAYFWHIPKTAGTSVRRWLASNLEASLCRAGVVDELVTMPTSEIEHYRAFAGHFHGYLAQYVRDEMISFSVLRDPIARTKSHWNQVRRAPWHPHYQRVRLQSFTEFVQDDGNRVMIENYQARYLCKLPIDLELLAKSYSPDQLAGYALAETVEQRSLNISASFLAASSHETLSGMAAVGVSERLHDFLLEVGRILSLPVPPLEATPKENVAGQDDGVGLSAAALDRLNRLTQIDRELYDAARRRVLTPGGAGPEPAY
jgi:hypothetical protein